MSDYRISYTSTISAKDAEYLENMLGIIDQNDKVTIVLEEWLSDEIDKILKLLHENDFDCKTRAEGEGGGLVITAMKDNIARTGITDVY